MLEHFDYDVLENGLVVGRIFFASRAARRPLDVGEYRHSGDIKRTAPGNEPTRRRPQEWAAREQCSGGRTAFALACY